MKKLRQLLFSIAILLNIISFKSFAQAQEWEWAKSAGGQGNDYSYGTTTDNDGNLYITGRMTSPSATFGTFVLNGKGAEDVFIAKYDKSGNVIWARSAGGDSLDESYSIVYDKIGNIYITGIFKSPSITFGNITLLNEWPGKENIFVAKYDINGNVIWAKSAGSNGVDIAFNAAVDNVGNIYITGYFKSQTITFGNFILKRDTTSADNHNMFLVKYDINGNVQWAHSADESSGSVAQNVTTDTFGNIYVTGYFKNTSIVFDTITLQSRGKNDLFIVKYDSNGQVKWAKSAGGNSKETSMIFSRGITADKNGNVYLTGEFYGTSISFGDSTFSSENNTNYLVNYFIVKYDSSGGVKWANTTTGDMNVSGYNIHMDITGHPWVVGYYSGQSITLGSTKLINTKGIFYDIFIAKYDSIGNILLAKSVGGTNSDFGFGITSDSSGSIFITGCFFSSDVDFGTKTLTNSKTDLADIFIAKMNFPVTGIEKEPKSGTQLNIFPNPTASQFHITNLEPGNWTITIYTLDGQSVFKKELTEANAMIDLSGKAKGAYVYRLLKDGEVFKSGKLVVE
ncbi:MAG: SBBP repeat-containing protein [Bacteroidota bacterium]